MSQNRCTESAGRTGMGTPSFIKLADSHHLPSSETIACRIIVVSHHALLGFSLQNGPKTSSPAIGRALRPALWI